MGLANGCTKLCTKLCMDFIVLAMGLAKYLFLVLCNVSNMIAYVPYYQMMSENAMNRCFWVSVLTKDGRIILWLYAIMDSWRKHTHTYSIIKQDF